MKCSTMQIKFLIIFMKEFNTAVKVACQKVVLRIPKTQANERNTGSTYVKKKIKKKTKEIYGLL